LGRDKVVRGKVVQVGSQIPEDDYNIITKDLGRNSHSQYIRDKYKIDADKIREREQTKQIISQPMDKSAIGSMCNNANLKDPHESIETYLAGIESKIKRLLPESAIKKVLRIESIKERITAMLDAVIGSRTIVPKGKRLEDRLLTQQQERQTAQAKEYRKQHERQQFVDVDPFTLKDKVIGDGKKEDVIEDEQGIVEE
jgi:hypothetical protein